MAHSVLLKGPSNYAADLRLGEHRYGVELNFFSDVRSGPVSIHRSLGMPLPKSATNEGGSISFDHRGGAGHDTVRNS